MGGNIRVESRPGEGSTFIVILQLRQADDESPIEESKPVSVLSSLYGISILLLDDDIRQLRITGEMLKRLGADCTLCTTSRELISQIREKSYDVLLTDIQMPEMDGYKATQAIRNLTDKDKACIPIIAMTANAFQEDAEKCIAVGMNAHLAKPLDIEKVMITICHLVKKKNE